MTFAGNPPEAPSSARKVSLLAGLGGLLLGLFLGAVGTLAIVNLADGDDDEVRESDTSVASSAADSEDQVDVEEDEAAYIPTADDFTVELTVKDRECFGSAGCNVTYRVSPNYSALETPEGTWEITYEVSGIEDGPQIETFTLDGDQFSFNPEVQVQTSGPHTKAKVTVTNVIEGY